MICPFFPPSKGPAADRIYSLASACSSKGIKVKVFTSRSHDTHLRPSLDNVDVIYDTQISSVVDHATFSSSQIFTKFFSFIARFSFLNNFKMFDFLYSFTKYGRWAKNILPIIEYHLKINDYPEYVLASYPDRSSINLASFIHDKYSIKWCVDYRDLWSYNEYVKSFGFFNKLKKNKEYGLIKTADFFLFASTSIKIKFLQHFKISADKCHSLYNGFDGSLLPSPIVLPSNPISFVHTGSLYNGIRDAEPFFKLLYYFPESIINFYVFTKSDASYINRISPISLKNRIKIFVNSSREACLNAQKNADFLLLIMSGTTLDASYPTAKLFEYIKSSRPILSNAIKDSEVQTILYKTQTGLSLDDYLSNHIFILNRSESISFYERSIQAKVFTDIILSNTSCQTHNQINS